MATQRRGAEGKANGDPMRDEKTSDLTEERKKRQFRKNQQLQEQKKWVTMRWIVVVIVLVLAALGLYYYFTYYYPRLPTVQPASKSAASRDGSKHGGRVKKGKKTMSSKTSKGSKVRKGAESSAVKDGKGSSKTKDSSTKASAGKRKNSAKEQKQTTGRKSSSKARGGGGDSKPTKEVNVNDLPLLKRPVPPSDSDRPHIIEILTGANLLEGKQYQEALERFNSILKSFKQSPRALYGKAITLYYMAMEKRSNKLMDTSIDFFNKVGIESFLTPEDIRVSALLQLSYLAQQRGKQHLSVKALEKLCEIRSDDPFYANKLGVGYLAGGNIRKAKAQFKKILKEFPQDYFAKAHMGFVLFSEKRFEEALPLLLEGLKKDPDIKTNPRFYLYAGETLTRLNRSDEALVLYGEAVAKDLLPSVWQRSLYNEPGLRAMPWWGVGETGYGTQLKRIVKALGNITREALSILDHDKTSFPGQSPHFPLFSNGKKEAINCNKAPKTCALIETFPEAAGCKTGEVRFSVMPPRTHVLPFVGLTNTRLQVVAGLEIGGKLRMRSGEEERILSEGKLVVTDDSFEQELWYSGSQPAVVLAVHVWHPDLSEVQQRKLQLQDNIWEGKPGDEARTLKHQPSATAHTNLHNSL